MRFTNVPKNIITCSLVILGLTLLFSLGGSSATYAQNGPAFVRWVRAMEAEETGITNPAGLAYSSRGKAFHVAAGRARGLQPPAETDVVKLTPYADRRGSARIAAAIKDPINMAFDNRARRLFIFQSPANKLIEVLEDSGGNLDPRTLIRHDARRFGLQNPQGMTVDPASGDLFVLDTVGPRIVRIKPEADGTFDQAVISEVDLQSTGIANPRGLAFDPTSGHLHVVSLADQMLYEMSQSGQVVVTRDLSALNLSDPQGMVFAPSGDMTDDPTEISLYITDSGLADATQNQSGRSLQNPTGSQATGPFEFGIYLPLIVRGADGEPVVVTPPDTAQVSAAAQAPGEIVELSFTEPPAPAASSFQATLVRTIDTSQWSPPSPDPSGITYLPSKDNLLIADGEVNEMPIFDGANLFEATRAGTLVVTGCTSNNPHPACVINFTNEPTGVTYNPNNQHIFISSDDEREIYEVVAGPDGVYGTSDDTVTSFDTAVFNSMDPEGITFANGDLFIADGLNAEVYHVTAGPNGIFDGVAPEGDDQVTSFDTFALGIIDLEGIVYDSDNDYLYLVGVPRTSLVHLTTAGEVVRLLDISEAGPLNPAGLTFAPGSSLNSGVMNIYIADRAVDNNNDPTENDGRVYEMSIAPLTQGNNPPVVDAGPDQSITLPNAAKLAGRIVADDGVPVATATTWSQVSGPGSVIFANASALDTTASFTLPGSYVLRLTADDTELSGKDEVTITVSGEAAVSFLDVGITGTEPDNPARSSDDAEEVDNANSSLDRFSADLDMLFDRGLNRTNKIVGLRFAAVNLPRGTIITNAYVQFQVDEISSAITSLLVQGQAADNPVTFGFDDKIVPRPRTTAEVSWSPPPWLTVGEAGADQRTPNLTAIIQEIVDRDLWSSGNALVIMISGSGERTAVAFEGDPAAAPLLHVEYQLRVPDVVGQPQANAEATIRAARLTVGTVTFENSGSVPAGNVISQDPPAGSLVPEGSAVNLVVSLGPVTVPDVVGQPQANAEAAIRAAGLTVGNVTTANSETVPAGAVISQNPVGESQVAPGSAVDLVVSLGPAPVTVPNVVGQPQADAQAAIVAAGLSVGTITEQNSGSVPAGAVISQNPVGGTQVPPSSALDLVVSLGPVAVPDVVGQSQADAEAAIMAAGLAVGTVTFENSDTAPRDNVISQNPSGGSQVGPDTPVDLVVSLGSETVIDLGEAGNYAVLGLTGAKIKIEDNNPGVSGDVGLGPNGEGEFKNGFIAGTLLVDPSAKVKELKTAIADGTVVEPLSPAVADALQASSDAAGLSPTETFNEIKETRTIAANGKLTVVAVNKIELKDGKILTLRGGPGDEFVINISDKLELDNGSVIQLDGGLPAGNVLFNFTKKAKGEIKGGSRASGIFLAPGNDAVLTIEGQGTTVTGALLAGKEIKIAKNARLVAPGSELVLDLGEAGEFAVLGLAAAKIKMEDNNSSVSGDVGLGPHGEGEFKAGSIAGTLFFDPTATMKELKIVVEGGIVEEPLSPAVADALRASSDAANLPPTQSFQDIKETQTIEANGNLTVVAVNKIELKDGKILTLRGGSEDKFVVNISEEVKLENGGEIQLAGGLQAGNVLHNLTKKDAKVEIKKSSRAAGSFLVVGPDGVLTVEDKATVVGAVLASKEISIKKEAQVISP